MARDLSLLQRDPLGVERVQLERLALTSLQLVAELTPAERRRLARLDSTSDQSLTSLGSSQPLTSAGSTTAGALVAAPLPPRLEPVTRALRALLTRALESAARALDVKATSPLTSSRPGESIGRTIARVAAQLLARFASRVARLLEDAPHPFPTPPRSRPTRPTLPAPTSPSPAEDPRTWLSHAATSVATQAQSEAVLQLAPYALPSVAADPSFPGTPSRPDPLHKLWMARQDGRTRPHHRRLAGRSVPLGRPFWRSLDPSNPGALSYPGDPSAPLQETINCRCWLWLVPASEASTARSLFAYGPPPTLPVAASSR